MKPESLDRRDFLKQTSVAGLGALAASRSIGPLFVFNGSPAEKMTVAVMGLNGRGMVHAQDFARGANTTVAYLCDVDSNVLAKALTATSPLQSTRPKTVTDFRRILEDKSVDAISIATPDHWHTPATILALDAGKHVYLEKPSGHDPREDELVVAAARKHSKLHVQLGTQARSGPHFIEVLQLVRGGLIGTPYLARAWYANTRTGIGKGKVVPVPANLDYELWQGPAPRAPYRDNIIHYNWHWFTNWGTGEICNNGTHEIDVARWLLGVDYPTSVDSTGGRFHYADDWQFPDTQEATFVFEGGKSIIWQGQSCNGLELYGRSRGTTVLGTNGSVVVDRDGYVVYDLKNKIVKEVKAAPKGDSLNTVGDDWLTQLHIDNFVSAVRTGTKLSAPIEDGAKTGMLCHLGTISQQVGRKLATDRKNGHILRDDEAAGRWSREYDPPVEAGGVSELHEDRYFDSDPVVRRHARALHDETRALPIVSPHGHVDAAVLATNDAFTDPTSLIVTPDHYILRMLYSRGVSLESLGVAPLDGTPPNAEKDPRKIWQTFADHWHLFRATPTRAWLEYELREVFGVERDLDSKSALRVYDAIAERLSSPEFRPRALFKRFNIEVLATTDAASDTLEHHKALRTTDLAGRVIPTFRPDALFRIASPLWSAELERFGRVAGAAIGDYSAFVKALARRRADFKAMGATATDNAVVVPHTERLKDADAERLFAKAFRGAATEEDQARFEAHLLMEMARISVDDGLVMQLHAGALRNHNEAVYRRFGPDRGGDIPVTTEFTRNLRPLLNAYGNDARFRLIVFTLDESTYSRELAPLAGHYPALLLGAPWWFHDSIEGMTRFRQQTTETAGIANTAGFTDDTRAFCSIPARHDLARRVDANYLGGLVARHVIDMTDASEMAKAMAYDLAKTAYRLT